jgi:CDGSH-type Zn-finger protein
MTDAQNFGSRTEAAQVRIYPNGPMLVRGSVEIVDAEGNTLSPRRRVVALCRCGHSALNPLCDGTHKLVRRFRPDA